MAALPPSELPLHLDGLAHHALLVDNRIAHLDNALHGVAQLSWDSFERVEERPIAKDYRRGASKFVLQEARIAPHRHAFHDLWDRDMHSIANHHIAGYGLYAHTIALRGSDGANRGATYTQSNN